MATYAIGDIQGCYNEFRALLAKLAFSETHDTLWLVGDLVNRGPDNVSTLDYIMSLPNVVTVLGNHDLHLIAVAAGVREPSGLDTIGDVLASTRRDAMITWLRQQKLLHVDATRNIVMVHAGLPPIWDVVTSLARAREVESMLRSDHYMDFIGSMYGNEPAIWDDTLTGNDRLRIITNYLTRLRYCTVHGKLELTSKADIKPAGFEPWFTFPRPDATTTRYLFGHWAALEGETSDAAFLALDTGCVWGRELTAYCVDDGTRFSVPAQKR